MSGTDAAGSTSADNKRKQQDPAKFKRKRGMGKGAESNNKFRKGNGQKQKGGKKKPPGTEKAEYIIKDGVRHVKPYVHSFNTHAKGRWFGRSILEVTTTEFGGNDAAYFSNCIKMGFIKVNGEIVAEDYKFKNGDHMTHLTHRHEPPTKGEVKFIGQTDTLFAVSKPSSMPMHPCGAYRFNSLTSILESKDDVENQSKQLLLVRDKD